MRVFLIVLFLLGISVDLYFQDSNAEKLYFDPDFDFINDDRFERDRRYLLGDTVTIIGHSEEYNEKTDSHIPLPDSSFEVKIQDPNQRTILDEIYFANEKGNIEFSFVLSEEFIPGEYFVEMIVKSKFHQKYLDWSFFVGHSKEMIVQTDSKIKLHTKEMRPVLLSSVDLIGIVCGEPMSRSDNDQTAYLLPHTGRILERQSMQVHATFTNPVGEKIESSSHYNKSDDCTEFEIGPKSNVSGIWSANATAWWIEGNTIYQATSDEMQFTVREPIFYNDSVEKLDVVLPDRMYLLDWHPDGKSILMNQQNGKIVILDLETLQIETVFDPPDPEIDVHGAKFSNDGHIYITDDEGFWQYFPESGERQKILSEIAAFDVLDNGKIMYSVSADKPFGETNFDLYVANGDGTEPKLIHNDYDLWEFDANSDGTKVVFRNTIDSGMYWKQKELEVLDVETQTTFVVPNVKQSCGRTPQLTPGGDMIVHHTSSCSRGWPGGIVHISTLDGTYTETIIPSSNYNPNFLVSPDGQHIITTSFGEKYHDPSTLYKVTLSKSIPEFGTITIIVLAASIVSMIILLKSRICFSLQS